MNTDDARTASLTHAWAAEAGRGVDTWPAYALGQLGQEWRDAWRTGWRSVRG